MKYDMSDKIGPDDGGDLGDEINLGELPGVEGRTETRSGPESGRDAGGGQQPGAADLPDASDEGATEASGGEIKGISEAELASAFEAELGDATEPGGGGEYETEVVEPLHDEAGDPGGKEPEEGSLEDAGGLEDASRPGRDLPLEEERGEAPPDEPASGSDVGPAAGRVRGWYPKKYEKAVCILIAVLSVWLGVFGLKNLIVPPAREKKRMASTRVYMASITSNSGATLDLKPFIVIFPNDHESSYLSLTVSLRFSHSSIDDIYKEIHTKKALVRGVIYGVLEQAVTAGVPDTMSAGQLKQDIISALNALLATGRIDEVYFTDFLVV